MLYCDTITMVFGHHITQTIFQEIRKLKPQLVIVDSIQTLQSNLIDSSAGSVSQIRECAAEFQRFANETNTPVFH